MGVMASPRYCCFPTKLFLKILCTVLTKVTYRGSLGTICATSGTLPSGQVSCPSVAILKIGSVE